MRRLPSFTSGVSRVLLFHRQVIIIINPNVLSVQWITQFPRPLREKKIREMSFPEQKQRWIPPRLLNASIERKESLQATVTLQTPQVCNRKSRRQPP